MSSHWEWCEEMIVKHDAEKPYSPENGQPLKFKVGDRVIYTNDYGVQFTFTITSLYKPDKTTVYYALGQRYNLDWECHWVSVPESRLS